MKLLKALFLAAIAATAQAQTVSLGTVSNGGGTGAEVTAATTYKGYNLGAVLGGVSDRQYFGAQVTSGDFWSFARIGAGVAYTRADYSKETPAPAPCLICVNPPATVTSGTNSKVSPFVQLEAFYKLEGGAEVFAQTRYFTRFANDENDTKGRYFTGVGIRWSFE